MLIFFLEYFKPDSILFLSAREIAGVEVPFGTSPNSFKPSNISFKDEVGLAFLQVSINCKLLGFPPACFCGLTVPSVCRAFMAMRRMLPLVTKQVTRSNSLVLT